MDGFSWDFLLTATVTLFFVIDPLGVIPIFASLTAGRSFGNRAMTAFRGVFIAGVIMSLFALGGQTLLERIGIGMPAFRTAGGILLFLIGLEMIFERRTPRRSRFAERSVAEHEMSASDHSKPEDIAVFPLAMPLLAGPGALASLVLLMGENNGSLMSQASVLIALYLVLLVAFLLLVVAVPLVDRAGETFSIVVTRIFGTLLAALSVQYIFDGIATYFTMSVRSSL